MGDTSPKEYGEKKSKCCLGVLHRVGSRITSLDVLYFLLNSIVGAHPHLHSQRLLQEVSRVKKRLLMGDN